MRETGLLTKIYEARLDTAVKYTSGYTQDNFVNSNQEFILTLIGSKVAFEPYIIGISLSIIKLASEMVNYSKLLYILMFYCYSIYAFFYCVCIQCYILYQEENLVGGLATLLHHRLKCIFNNKT